MNLHWNERRCIYSKTLIKIYLIYIHCFGVLRVTWCYCYFNQRTHLKHQSINCYKPSFNWKRLKKNLNFYICTVCKDGILNAEYVRGLFGNIWYTQFNCYLWWWILMKIDINIKETLSKMEQSKIKSSYFVDDLTETGRWSAN